VSGANKFNIELPYPFAPVLENVQQCSQNVYPY